MQGYRFFNVVIPFFRTSLPNFIRETSFVVIFAFGMLFIHELGHLIGHILLNHKIGQVILFPFLYMDTPYFFLRIEYLYGHTDLEVFKTVTMDLIMPFVFQCGYLILFRKKFTSMELKLWGLVSILYMRGDIIAFIKKIQEILL